MLENLAINDIQENERLKKQVKGIQEKLELVLSQLSKKSVNKDSKNSHNPPSQDKTPSKKKSLRKKSDRPAGGQQPRRQRDEAASSRALWKDSGALVSMQLVFVLRRRLSRDL